MRDSIADDLFGGSEKGSITFGLVQKCVGNIYWLKNLAFNYTKSRIK